MLVLCCSEVIDAMFQPSKYDTVYPFSYLYTYFVSTPHSILIQLASPTANKEFGRSIICCLPNPPLSPSPHSCTGSRA